MSGPLRAVVLAASVTLLAACTTSESRSPEQPVGPATTVLVLPTDPVTDSAAPATEPVPDTAAPTAVTPTTVAAAGSPTASSAGTPVLAFFVRDERIAPVRRFAPPGASELGVAVEALLAGPTEAETAAGLVTTVPGGVRLRSVYVVGGVAFIDLDRSFESGGGSASMLLRLAQLTATATAAPGVEAVRIRLDGEWVTTFSGEGLVLDHPWTRLDIEDQTPIILVERPAPGDRVVAPIRITGTANAFEATFQVQVLAADGTLLADFMTMASSGTGTRGDFDVTAPAAGWTGPATVRVLEYSARDGSETNVVEVPVVLERADSGA